MKHFNSISTGRTEDIIYLFMLFFYSYVAILNDSLLQLTAVIRFLEWGLSAAGVILFLYRNRGIPPVKKMVFASIVMVAFYIAAKTTGRTYLILYAVFIIIAEGCDPDKTVKIWLISTVSALLTILILCRIGVLTDNIFLYDSGRACHCLGFGYYSYFPFLVFCCSIAYIYLKKDNVNFYHYVLVGLVNLIMYHLTTLNLTFYLTFVFIVIDCLLVKVIKLDLNRKPIMAFSGLLYPLGIMATFFMMAKYNPEDTRWVSLNNVLHGRLAFMHLGYQRYPISLVGNRIKMIGNSTLRTVAPGEYFYIDSGFAYSLLGYGLIFTFVAVLLYSILYVFSCQTNNKHLFAWLTCIVFFTMMNNMWVDVYYNPALLISFTAYTELQKREGRWQPILITVETVGLVAAAVWLVPWLKTLGDATIGGNSRLALLAAGLLLLLLLGLSFSLGSLLLKLLQHQQPGKRELVCTGALLLCCVGWILMLNGQLNRLTARNAEKLESERLAVETVQQEGCRLLVDGPAEMYRRTFGEVGHSLYQGNDIVCESDVAYITDVENEYPALINRGFKYTEISSDHAIYTNSPEAEGALRDAGYHLTGFYSHDCVLDLNAVSLAAYEKPLPEDAAIDLLADGAIAHSIPLTLQASPYRVTYELVLQLKDGKESPKPDAEMAIIKAVFENGTTVLAEQVVRFSDFDRWGRCSAVLDFTVWGAEDAEFLIEPAEETFEWVKNLLLLGVRYWKNPVYDTHAYYDVNERVIWEDFYDLDGNPITIQDGSHAREYGYDRNGNRTLIRYMDMNYNPVTNINGYAEVHREFNANRQLLREEYYDENGSPCVQAAGHVAIEQEYDSAGNLVCRQYLNENGTPCLRKDGFSEARWSKTEGSSVWNLNLFSLNGERIPPDGINLAKDIQGKEWSAWMKPAYSTVNFGFNIGSMNLGEKRSGDCYTCQIEVEFSGVTAIPGQDFLFATQGSTDGVWTIGNVWDWNLVQMHDAPEDGIYRFLMTHSIDDAMANASTFEIGFRCDNWASGAFRVRNVKVEKGDTATVWSPGI